MSSKKRKADSNDAKDAEISQLKAEVASLKEALAVSTSYERTLYSSMDAAIHPVQLEGIPKHGMNPRHIKEILGSFHDTDNQPRLNTSSVSSCSPSPLDSSVNYDNFSLFPMLLLLLVC